jgi:hypothetical protein
VNDPIRLRKAVSMLAALWVGAIAMAVALRIGFPTELEWMEGGSLQHALWIQRGNPVYPTPSADFVPFLYTPLYAMVLAGLGLVLPLGLFLGRLVSVMAWVAIGLAIWRTLKREGKPPSHAAAGIGLMCSGYIFAFRWMDLARADALFMGLLVWGLVLLRESWGDHRKAALAGLLVALAFWTKQTAFIFILASAAGALLVAPRQLLTYAAVIAVVDGGGVLLGSWLGEGTLWTYIYELHQSHAFNHERFRVKTWAMFLHAAPFAVLLVGAIIVRLALPWIQNRGRLDPQTEEAQGAGLLAHRGTLYWLVMAMAGLLASALGYSTQWAEPNAFVPGVILGALLIAVGLPVGGRAEVLGLGMVAGQLVFSAVLEPRYHVVQDQGPAAVLRSYAWQDPGRTVPSAQLREAAGAMQIDLEASGLRVLALHRPWWSVMAGGPGHVGSMGIADVDRAARQGIQAELRRRLRKVEYDAVWLEGEPPAWMRRALSQGYRLERRLVGTDRVRPMSGYMSEAGMVTPYSRPQLLFVPAAARPPVKGATLVLDFEDGSVRGLARTGRAFGTRPVRPLAGEARAVGPHGGEFFLSSATASGRRKLVGSMTTDPIALRDGQSISLWMGSSRISTELRVEVLTAQTDEVLGTLGATGPAQVLQPRQWAADRSRSIRLRFVDDDPRGSLFIDDVWVLPASD